MIHDKQYFLSLFSFGSSGGVNMWVDQESQLYILCPSVAITDTVQDIMTDQQQMYENMYLVTKEEFESCSLDDHRGTLVASLLYLLYFCDFSNSRT